MPLGKSQKTGLPENRGTSKKSSRVNTAPHQKKLRFRKQFRAPAGQPTDEQANPLVGRSVGELQSIACGPERSREILRATRAPINWIGFDGKSRLPKSANGARHMVRGSNQQPSLVRLRIGNGLGEFRVLVGVAGAILGDQPARRDTEIFEEAFCQLGFRDLTDAAREHQPRVGIFAREFDGARHALGRFVKRDLAAPSRDPGVERTAEHDDAVGCAAYGLPRGKALLEGQDQGI
jgi:hypothetical protein